MLRRTLVCPTWQCGGLGGRRFVLLLTACVAFHVEVGETATVGDPDFRSVLEIHGEHLSAITSDREALALFKTSLAADLGLSEVQPRLREKSSESGTRREAISQPPDPSEAATMLVTELAAWRLGLSVEETVNRTDTAALETLFKTNPTHHAWLLTDGRHPHLSQAIDLGSVLIAFESAQDAESQSATGYEAYATALDAAYPNLTGPDDSWLAVAEQAGAEGVRRRLLQVEEIADHRDADKERLATRYFTTRVRPAVQAQIIATAIRAEIEAERAVRKSWQELRTWPEQLRAWRGLVRLCGTWQWTVHNHRNHQDHKMVMRFLPPGASDAMAGSAPSPTKIVVTGDTVFLRWEFQGGVQEDSLLFVNKGQRLEGTFINSAGAWGSIAGKRAAPCGR
ncbi:MAG: hypothetical protein ACE5NA_01490 [Nitrospiraceae bacterium]